MSVFAKSGFSAKSYAAFRPTYPALLYSKISAYAQDNGASNGDGDEIARSTCCIDLGCGHGIAGASLAPKFSETIGIDPSAGMIAQAREQHNGTSNIRFHHGAAEDLSFLPEQSVDLVVSAQAAHWFDYSRLWPELARVVRPKGTVAFWGYKDNIIVGQEEVNRIFERFVYGTGEVAEGVEGLGKYWEQPGRNILRRLYRDIQPPVAEWDRVERSEHEPGEEGPGEPAWTLRKKMTLGAIESYFRTYSSYSAWKDAGKVDPDVYNVMWKEVVEVVDSWRRQGDKWRDIEVETDWGTCLLMARRR